MDPRAVVRWVARLDRVIARASGSELHARLLERMRAAAREDPRLFWAAATPTARGALRAYVLLAVRS